LKLQISEPWDFESPSGTNIVDIKLIKRISEVKSKKNYILTRILEPFVYANYNFKYLVLSPRYTDSTIDDVYSGTTVGIGILNVEVNENIMQEFSMDNVKYCAIGRSIKK